MSIKMPNISVAGGKIMISGRADWSLGYCSVRGEGTLLVAIGAKKRSEFSGGEAQLIAYLAILREHRRRMGNIRVWRSEYFSLLFPLLQP
jgi:hypothetical protein